MAKLWYIAHAQTQISCTCSNIITSNLLHVLKQHQISCTCSNIYHQISHLQLAHSYQKLCQLQKLATTKDSYWSLREQSLLQHHQEIYIIICKKFEQMANYQPACPASPLSGSSFAYPHCIQTGQLVSCIISLEKQVKYAYYIHTVAFKFVHKKQHSHKNNNNNNTEWTKNRFFKRLWL